MIIITTLTSKKIALRVTDVASVREQVAGGVIIYTDAGYAHGRDSWSVKTLQGPDGKTYHQPSFNKVVEVVSDMRWWPRSDTPSPMALKLAAAKGVAAGLAADPKGL